MRKAAYDIAVAGAGIVGAAVAHACAARGARVLLLERDRPGAHASGAAAGMLAPCSEAHGPGAFLDLAQESLARWPALAERLRAQTGIDPELRLDGLLRVVLDEAGRHEMQARLAWQQDAGIAAEWLDVPAVLTREPAVDPGIAGAILYPGDGHVHSPRAVRALVEAARQLGAEVRCGVEVRGLDAAGQLLLDNGEPVRCSALVLCTGSWTARLGDALGVPPLPVRPVRGQLVAIEGLTPLPRHVLFAGREGYAVAKADGLVLVGATEEDAGFDARVVTAATERLLAVGRRLLAGFGSATLAHAWAGLRPRTPDGLPLLGRLGAARGTELFVAAGHHRNGVLLAPATGDGMGEMVLGGRTPHGWEAFDPRRFD